MNFNFYLTLFFIFRRIFFNDFSSALVNGNLVGTGYPSAISVLFSSSVRTKVPVEPFCNQTVFIFNTQKKNWFSYRLTADEGGVYGLAGGGMMIQYNSIRSIFTHIRWRWLGYSRIIFTIFTTTTWWWCWRQMESCSWFNFDIKSRHLHPLRYNIMRRTDHNICLFQNRLCIFLKIDYHFG